MTQGDSGKGSKRRPMTVTRKIYSDRYDKAFGKSRGRKKSCNGCSYLTMKINPTCIKCNGRNMYQKSIGSVFADDINTGESN